MSTRPILRLAMMALLGAGGCLPSLSLDPDGGAQSGSKNPGKGGGGTIITDGGVVLPANADLAVPPDMAVDPVQLFNAEVAPILTMSCAGCHNKVGGIGPGFLAPDPDMLTTMLAYPGLIGLSPDTSRIYVKGVHEGPGLTGTQKPVISDWIKLWNANKPKSLDGGAEKPSVMPFAPVIGANSIDLSVIDTTLAGQKITFTAKMVGTTLELTAINIVAAAGMGVHVVHPLWVTWDAMMTPTPDPVDSFSNLDETVTDGQTKAMGPGTLFLPGFAGTMMVNVVFATIEAKSGSADGGIGTLGCKNVASWTTNTKPQLSNNCVSCHGGSNSSATMALPLQAANPDAQNCAATLGEVDLTTPANGRLESYPNPANPNNGHPFHFPDTTTYQAFTTAVGTWIANEK